jgi:hypothetical protein
MAAEGNDNWLKLGFFTHTYPGNFVKFLIWYYFNRTTGPFCQAKSKPRNIPPKERSLSVSVDLKMPSSPV